MKKQPIKAFSAIAMTVIFLSGCHGVDKPNNHITTAPTKQVISSGAILPHYTQETVSNRLNELTTRYEHQVETITGSQCLAIGELENVLKEIQDLIHQALAHGVHTVKLNGNDISLDTVLSDINESNSAQIFTLFRKMLKKHGVSQQQISLLPSESEDEIIVYGGNHCTGTPLTKIAQKDLQNDPEFAQISELL